MLVTVNMQCPVGALLQNPGTLFASIRRIIAGTPAAIAGLRAGDIIVTVDGKYRPVREDFVGRVCLVVWRRDALCEAAGEDNR